MTEELSCFDIKPAPLSILLLVEKGFTRRCADVEDYVKKLKDYFVREKGENVCIYTPSTNYNLSFEGVTMVELECQNKTAFVFSLENSIDMYDECYIISQRNTTDPYLDGARETMTTHNRSVTHLGYVTK